MTLRPTFTFKIQAPFFLLAALFLLGILYRGDEAAPLFLLLMLSGAGISILAAILLSSWLGRALKRTSSLAAKLNAGEIPHYRASSSGAEIRELELMMEQHVERLRSIAAFLAELSKGNLEPEFQKLAADDVLGEAMISLKKSLEASALEGAELQDEEKNRTWTAQGLARFGKLFRESSGAMHDLAMAFTRELVDYTRADVAALFITREDEKDGPSLELMGSYAFDRHKYSKDNIAFGEGLVGRTALEKEIIYLTDLPPETLKIRSGLGEDVPTSLLLVPVKLDQEVLGVIELASLEEFPAYQVEFLRQLGGALATTIANMAANLKTRKQAEALASQEAVFRKKLDDLERELEKLRKS